MICACFPKDGVPFIMPIDRAVKVFPVPEIVSPILHSEYDSRDKHHPGAFVAKTLTQSQSPKQTHATSDYCFLSQVIGCPLLSPRSPTPGYPHPWKSVIL